MLAGAGALQLTSSAPGIDDCVLQAPDHSIFGEEQAYLTGTLTNSAAPVLSSAMQAPDHSIFGEEQGYLAGNGSSEWLWVIDPIDGTKSFITGGCCA